MNVSGSLSLWSGIHGQGLGCQETFLCDRQRPIHRFKDVKKLIQCVFGTNVKRIWTHLYTFYIFVVLMSINIKYNEDAGRGLESACLSVAA